ncbi:MAG TPA: protein kinase, partial [Telluria sp.]
MIQALPGYTVAQLLRDDPQFVLLRAVRDADGVAVLVLVARDGCADACLRLENEYALRAELDRAWAAVPLELVRSSATLALVLADDGVAPLSPLPAQALPTARFVTLASAIAGALVQMHRRQLVHKDLRPEHLLVDAAGSVRLTGFGLAGPL